MSTTKTKEELVRLAWIAALRRQGHRQCTEDLVSDDGVSVCAMGLLLEIVDPSMAWPYGTDHNEIGAFAGLNIRRSNKVIRLNDGLYPHRAHSFAEIADVVERWFKKTLGMQSSICKRH